jgi:hypothetical protein
MFLPSKRGFSLLNNDQLVVLRGLCPCGVSSKAINIFPNAKGVTK